MFYIGNYVKRKILISNIVIAFMSINANADRISSINVPDVVKNYNSQMLKFKYREKSIVQKINTPAEKSFYAAVLEGYMKNKIINEYGLHGGTENSVLYITGTPNEFNGTLPNGLQVAVGGSMDRGDDYIANVSYGVNNNDGATIAKLDFGKAWGVIGNNNSSIVAEKSSNSQWNIENGDMATEAEANKKSTGDWNIENSEGTLVASILTQPNHSGWGIYYDANKNLINSNFNDDELGSIDKVSNNTLSIDINNRLLENIVFSIDKAEYSRLSSNQQKIIYDNIKAKISSSMNHTKNSLVDSWKKLNTLQKASIFSYLYLNKDVIGYDFDSALLMKLNEVAGIWISTTEDKVLLSRPNALNYLEHQNDVAIATDRTAEKDETEQIKNGISTTTSKDKMLMLAYSDFKSMEPTRREYVEHLISGMSSAQRQQFIRSVRGYYASLTPAQQVKFSDDLISFINTPAKDIVDVIYNHVTLHEEFNAKAFKNNLVEMDPQEDNVIWFDSKKTGNELFQIEKFNNFDILTGVVHKTSTSSAPVYHDTVYNIGGIGEVGNSLYIVNNQGGVVQISTSPTETIDTNYSRTEMEYNLNHNDGNIYNEYKKYSKYFDGSANAETGHEFMDAQYIYNHPTKGAMTLYGYVQADTNAPLVNPKLYFKDNYNPGDYIDMYFTGSWLGSQNKYDGKVSPLSSTVNNKAAYEVAIEPQQGQRKIITAMISNPDSLNGYGDYFTGTEYKEEKNPDTSEATTPYVYAIEKNSYNLDDYINSSTTVGYVVPVAGNGISFTTKVPIKLPNNTVPAGAQVKMFSHSGGLVFVNDSGNPEASITGSGINTYTSAATNYYVKVNNYLYDYLSPNSFARILLPGGTNFPKKHLKWYESMPIRIAIGIPIFVGTMAVTDGAVAPLVEEGFGFTAGAMSAVSAIALSEAEHHGIYELVKLDSHPKSSNDVAYQIVTNPHDAW